MAGWSASLPVRAAQALRRRLVRARFDRLASRILATPPLLPRPASLCIVSMVGARDLAMYLVAVASLYRRLPGGQVVVLDDGTLGARERALLTSRLGAPRFVRIDEVETGACPRGGCWERLLQIADLSRDAYVIQMDSDTLATGPLPEVTDAIAANRAFTLGSDAQYRIVGLEEAAAAVAHQDSRELQFLAEQLLPGLPPGLGRRYVRGSAGFAGFPRGGAGRPAIEAFSRAMQGMMGARWTEWGTEQVASNWLVANAPGAQVLPWPKYRCFYGGHLPAETVMAHFVGTYRFDQGVYAARVRGVLAELAAPSPA